MQFKWLCQISLLFLLLFCSFSFAAGKAVVLTVNGAIGPAAQDYIERGIDYAVNERASAVILELNTPGGLETAMRGINAAIIKSTLPVITYVAPSGARAASAGIFIMYASHFAAMAPGTNAGAASPVSLTASQGSPSGKELSTEEKKAMSDASAYIRSLAQLRGRNAEWGELAVRKASSISAIEAKKLNVINEIAETYSELLNKLNGQTTLIQGVSKKIETDNLTLEKKPPGWRYEFLSFLTNPNMIYLLMFLAMYGLFFELSNPGLVLPGVVGMIALLLLLYALQLVSINYVGLALVFLGILFIIAEIVIGSFGIIGVGGVIAFIVGSIMLFDADGAAHRVALPLIISMSLLVPAFFLIVISLTLRSYKKRIVSGQEGLIGEHGIVIHAAANALQVRVLGEIWNAASKESLQPGQKIKVDHVNGLFLTVSSIHENQQQSGEIE